MSFYGYDSRCDVSELVGKVFESVEQTNEEVIFRSKIQSDSYALFHSQDCCESVYLDEVIGDLADLTDTPILLAEEATSGNLPPQNEYDESYTWTFYKFSTIKGSVTLRWYGSSNGYYSEEVTCGRWKEEQE